MEELIIRQCEHRDILQLSLLYMDIYNETNPVEKWNFISSQKLISFYFETCKELFFVSESNGDIIGGVCGQIKPWWNGNKIYNPEIFIKKEFRRRGLFKKLFAHFLKNAIIIYDVVSIEAITFGDRDFPIGYYDKIGLKKDKQLTLLDGKPIEILRILKS